MRVDAGTNSPYLHQSAGQRASAAGVERGAGASFSDVLAAATPSPAWPDAAGTGPTDFTRMTRQDMREWVNESIRGGEMSLEESSPFMAMTMKIPVTAGLGVGLEAESDATRYDFTQKVRDGILGARARNDAAGLQMLESALQIMQRYQGQAADARPAAFAQG